MDTLSPAAAAKTPTVSPHQGTTNATLSDTSSDAEVPTSEDREDFVARLKKEIETLKEKAVSLENDKEELAEKLQHKNTALKGVNYAYGKLIETNKKVEKERDGAVKNAKTLQDEVDATSKTLEERTKERDEAVKNVKTLQGELDATAKTLEERTKERDTAVQELNAVVEERDEANKAAAHQKALTSRANKRKREMEKFHFKAPGGIDELRKDRRTLEKGHDEKSFDLGWADANVKDMIELATVKLGSADKAALWLYSNNRQKEALEDPADPTKGFIADVSHSLGAYLGVEGVAMDTRIQQLEAQYSAIVLPPGVQASPSAFWDAIHAMHLP